MFIPTVLDSLDHMYADQDLLSCKNLFVIIKVTKPAMHSVLLLYFVFHVFNNINN